MFARLLFVCAQNVCRSPLAAAAFARGAGDGWDVASAGTHALDGAPACAMGASLEPAVGTHRSAPVAGDLVENVDLVIAASRVERAWLAREAPEARNRTFTLRELLLLDADLGSWSTPTGRDVPWISHYTAALNGRRGLAVVPSGRQPGIWSRDREHPLDIADVHHAGPRKHRRGLEAAAEDAVLLGHRLRARAAA